MEMMAVSTVPPLPPELWNFAVIAVLCGFVAWLLRLSQLCLTLVDARFAVRSGAVLQLRDLGPSLNVLESASLWHFQQLLRTKLKAEAAAMVAVRQPFEIPTASLTVTRAFAPGTDRATLREEPKLLFSFKVRTSVKCVVQVLWGVRADALLLEHAHDSGGAGAGSPLSSPRSPGRARELIPALQRLSAQRKGFRQRAAELPSILSRVRHQNRRYRLEDDKDGEKEDDGSCSLEHMVGEGNFRSASPPQRFETSGEHEFVAEMPGSRVAGPAEEIRSLLAEVAESDMPTATPAAAPGTPPATEPRYGAVVLIGALACVEDATSGGSSWRAGDVLWQCVAVDFLPTPAKAAKFSAVAVRQLTATAARVLEQQEIFGGRGGDAECVICLEGAQAAVLLPCRHLCVCRACLREIERCPICRAKFTSYVCFAEPGGGAKAAAAADASGATDPSDFEVKVV